MSVIVRPGYRKAIGDESCAICRNAWYSENSNDIFQTVCFGIPDVRIKLDHICDMFKRRLP
jgi:hypothetical protein